MALLASLIDSLWKWEKESLTMNGLRIIFTHGGKSQCLVMLTKQTALYVKGVSNLRQWESRRRNMLSGKHREYVRAHQQVPIA
ncbi:hypothetical protein DVA81_18670, partial [Acinetobacter baumannii]